MNKRVCPSCNVELGSHDQYFCTSCGNELPEDLVTQTNPTRTLHYVFDGKSDGSQNNLGNYLEKVKTSQLLRFFRKYFALFVPILFILFMFSTVYLLDNYGFYKGDFFSDYSKAFKELNAKIPSPFKLETPTTLLEKDASLLSAEKVLDLGLNLEAKIFDQENYMRYVPFEADYYVQVSDLDGFLKQFIESEDVRESSSTVSVLNSVEDHFAFFGVTNDEAVSYGMLFNLKTAAPVLEEGELFGAPYFTSTVGSVFVVSNDMDVLLKVQNTYNGYSKNFSQNPDAVRGLSNLPKSGQLLMVSLRTEPLDKLISSLEGKAVVYSEFVKLLADVYESGKLSFVVTRL